MKNRPALAGRPDKEPPEAQDSLLPLRTSLPVSQNRFRSSLQTKEKRHSFEYRFIGFRGLPILPGRFQWGTFSIWNVILLV